MQVDETEWESDVIDENYTAFVLSPDVDEEELQTCPNLLEKLHLQLDTTLRTFRDAYLMERTARMYSAGSMDVCYDELKHCIAKVRDLYVARTNSNEQDPCILFTFDWHCSTSTNGVYPNGTIIGGLALLKARDRLVSKQELEMIDTTRCFLDMDLLIREGINQKSPWHSILYECTTLLNDPPCPS